MVMWLELNIFLMVLWWEMQEMYPGLAII